MSKKVSNKPLKKNTTKKVKTKKKLDYTHSEGFMSEILLDYGIPFDQCFGINLTKEELRKAGL